MIRAFAAIVGGHRGRYLEHHFTPTFEAFDGSEQLTSRQSEYWLAHGVGGGAFAG